MAVQREELTQKRYLQFLEGGRIQRASPMQEQVQLRRQLNHDGSWRWRHIWWQILRERGE